MDNLQKIKEGYNHLMKCTLADHCEVQDCEYYTNPDELQEILDFLKDAIRQAEHREQISNSCKFE